MTYKLRRWIWRDIIAATSFRLAIDAESDGSLLGYEVYFYDEYEGEGVEAYGNAWRSEPAPVWADIVLRD